ncbi:dethiobiotin synthase [Echinicola soli]|uniref:ATP-dependent dethiobiotin synthetase BioD n=1 Tax=Echinicola soli TaxID=2591634 RepID=A0A514CCQ7_9BACT|nr:dethiobiotin synthase [Echinicola soli]QDH77593.1 dethiobiotin synthase [Echinicola soli]
MHKIKDKVFITGIGTGIGKTVCAAALCKTFGHAYWKPVQCGDLEQSDAMFVKRHSPQTEVLPEAYRLKTPQSPHLAAELENTTIQLTKQLIPDHPKCCIEGAGGLMVPLNDEETFLDFLISSRFHPVIVIRHYLGSINHSLLTLQALMEAGITDFTIIWNGPENTSSESAILKRFTPTAQFRMPEWKNRQRGLPLLNPLD